MHISGRRASLVRGASSLIAIGLALAGCATARLPLCPAIAEKSYASNGRGQLVNSFAARRADDHGIKINVLSPFAADFSGDVVSMRWFQRNYRLILCAFDPRQETHVATLYTSCMVHAPSWIAITQSSAPENLMLASTLYDDTCTELAQ